MHISALCCDCDRISRSESDEGDVNDVEGEAALGEGKTCRTLARAEEMGEEVSDVRYWSKNFSRSSVRTLSEKICKRGNRGPRAATKKGLTRVPRMPTRAERRSRRS